MATNTRILEFKRRAWRVAGWALALLCVFAPGLALAETLTGTFTGTDIGRVVAFTHDGRQRNDWAGVLRLQLDNGPEVPVFCVQLNVRVRSGDRYRSDGPVLALPNGCRIRYLLDAYPASTASDADEAAARQLAIWVFSDNLDPSTIQDAKVRDRTIALVAEAQGKPCPIAGTEAPALAIAPPAVSAAPGQVVSYTISAGASHAGQNVTVAVDGPAVISDANGTNSGQQQQQVALDGQGNAPIWVLSTGAGQSAVRATLPYQLDAGTVFSQIDDNHPTQRLVMAERQSLVASASAQGSWAGVSPPTPTDTSSAPATPPSAPETPPAQASPSPQTTAPPTQDTAVPQASPTQPLATATPVPTRRPSRSRSTPRPTAEQPTVASAQAATATTVSGPVGSTAPSSPAGNTGQSPVAEAPTAPAGSQQSGATGTNDQGSLANQSPAGGTGQTQAGGVGQSSAGATNQRAAGNAATRPSSLPRTGGSATPLLGVGLAGMLALLSGWILRRRVLRSR